MLGGLLQDRANLRRTESRIGGLHESRNARGQRRGCARAYGLNVPSVLRQPSEAEAAKAGTNRWRSCGWKGSRIRRDRSGQSRAATAADKSSWIARTSAEGASSRREVPTRRGETTEVGAEIAIERQAVGAIRARLPRGRSRREERRVRRRDDRNHARCLAG